MKRGVNINDCQWGLCEHCGRYEPIDGEGNVTAHAGLRGAMNDRGMCPGSLEAPAADRGPEMAEFAFIHKERAPDGPVNQRGRSEGFPVSDPFGHPLHEVAERMKTKAEKRKEKSHDAERG